MLVHDQEVLQVPRLTTLPPDIAASVIGPDSGYLVFGFVRNPYSRLFSAWSNKLKFVEPGYAGRTAEIKRAIGCPDRDTAPVSFDEFVNYVCRYEDRLLCDHHWVLQSALLFPEVITYSFIGRTDDVLTAELIERNRMIDVLYDKIDKLSDIICYLHAQVERRTGHLDRAYASLEKYAAMACTPGAPAGQRVPADRDAVRATSP